jgi:hypothetical protein
MIYKVSYVVQGGEYPGGIKNEYDRPEVGKTVQIGPMTFEVIEIHEIMPPRDDFQFLHATVKPLKKAEPEDKKSQKKS